MKKVLLLVSTLTTHARANNPLVEGYDPAKPSSWLSYLDCNNLYGWAMSQPLPVGNFRFLSQEEIADFDVMKIPTHGDTGYIAVSYTHLTLPTKRIV